MINWTVPAILFAVAAMLGSWLDGRFQQRTARSKRWRIVCAALPLPILIVAASGAGVVWELLRPRTGSTMTDLAVAVYLAAGGLLALLSLAGGLVGAMLAERETRR